MKIDVKTLEKLVWIIYKRFFIEKGKLKDIQIKIRYGFLKLNYAKMLQEWVKDIPQVSVNNTQIRVKNEYLQDIRLNSQEIELELY